MHSIILFYKYVSIQYPQQVLKWQKKICQELNLKGRIILAEEGINGTLGGTPENLNRYKQLMDEHPLFANIDFKETHNTGDHFPRLRIVVKDEIVNLGLDPKMVRAADAGIALEPVQAHQLIAKKPHNLVIIDCRNIVESEIGRIENAIRPATKYFREFPEYVDRNLENLKDKQVLMYCTGGVRCERATAYVKSKGVAQEVFHIKGGIQRYVEAFPNGFFKGKNYVFDGRTAVKVTDDILSHCRICQKPCDEYNNCMNAKCNLHFIGCSDCMDRMDICCSIECKNIITLDPRKRRPIPIRNYQEYSHTKTI
jgi:predicted sulfurtransferase